MSGETLLAGIDSLVTRRGTGGDGMPGDARARRVAAMIAVAGGLLALLVAAALYSRFSIDDWLRRDESIYLYSGQQFAHGVPVYDGIFDPKTPLASMFAGAAVAIARVVGGDEVHFVRAEFFVFACLTVAAVYVLALWLWGSVTGGIVSAITFASFSGFALDALGGPDAKTPGILFAAVSMALLVRRRWFSGAFAGAVAFLVWQPLAVYVLVAGLAALATAVPGERLRRLGRVAAGAAIPIAAVTLYFWIAGALHQLVETAITFPLTGVERGPESLHDHFDVIADVVGSDYGHTQLLFWGGLVALPLLAAWRLARDRAGLRNALTDPVMSVVMASLIPLAAFSVHDFQGYPDLYQALPYAAIGVGGVAAALAGAGRFVGRVATAGALVCAAALAALSWHWYSVPRGRDTALVGERANAVEIERLLDPGETLYALGDPTILVLTGRRNPSRFIYLGSGVAAWVEHHTPGGLEGWGRSIVASDPAVITLNDWNGRLRAPLGRLLRRTYDAGFVGKLRVFVKPSVRARAASRGVKITAAPAPEFSG